MAPKGHQCRTQSETSVNLKTTQRYFAQHFSRMRKIWEIDCIDEETWIKRREIEARLGENNKFTKQHKNSRLQQYATSSDSRRTQIDKLGCRVTENEIEIAIQKLRNRKTVGADEITDGIIKINADGALANTETTSQHM